MREKSHKKRILALAFVTVLTGILLLPVFVLPYIFDNEPVYAQEELVYTPPTIEGKDGNDYELNISGNIVEIGDTKEASFDQTVKYNRWGGESWFSVSLNIGKITTDSTMVADKVTWDSPELGIEIYGLDNTKIGTEFGGVEYNVILKQKPPSNVLTFNVEATSDVAFYYQPPLTQEEIEAGIFRPDNVIGSYAVYSTTKRNHIEGQINYATGKIGHIYRPQAVDSKGWTVWGELLIENGIMSVTLPQEFIDKAVYPIYHAAGDTFGYTGEGATMVGSLNDYIQGSQYTLSEDGDISKLTVSLSSGFTALTKCAIYNTDNDLMGATAEVELTSSGQAWRDYAYDPVLELASGDYRLVAWANFDFMEYVSIYGDDLASYNWYMDAESYNGFPNPSDLVDNEWFEFHASIYATYEAGGGCSPDIANTPDNKAFGLTEESETYTTGLDYYTITNNSGGAVTITIQATDFTGGNGWTLSDTATPDADTAGLKAGLEGGDYTIIVKKTPAYNTLVSGLADEATQKWGLKLYTPTSFSDGVQKSTTVTLTAVCD